MSEDTKLGELDRLVGAADRDQVERPAPTVEDELLGAGLDQNTRSETIENRHRRARSQQRDTDIRLHLRQHGASRQRKRRRKRGHNPGHEPAIHKAHQFPPIVPVFRLRVTHEAWILRALRATEKWTGCAIDDVRH